MWFKRIFYQFVSARRFLIVQSAGVSFFGLSNGYKFKQIEISVADRVDARFASSRANWRIFRSLLRVFQKNSLLQNSDKDNFK